MRHEPSYSGCKMILLDHRELCIHRGRHCKMRCVFSCAQKGRGVKNGNYWIICTLMLLFNNIQFWAQATKTGSVGLRMMLDWRTKNFTADNCRSAAQTSAEQLLTAATGWAAHRTTGLVPDRTAVMNKKGLTGSKATDSFKICMVQTGLDMFVMNLST